MKQTLKRQVHVPSNQIFNVIANVDVDLPSSFIHEFTNLLPPFFNYVSGTFVEPYFLFALCTVYSTLIIQWLNVCIYVNS